jgi:sigma-B regulation protein RsbU (phosphoserine phosphatase)
VKVLTPLASQVAIAIVNAALYEDLSQRDARLGRELTIARRVQHGLFPEEAPSGKGWEASAHFQPARELGGDLYDFYDVGEDAMAVAIGDVAGKGVPAALYGAFASGAVRPRAFQEESPAKLLYRVNRTLRRRGVEGLFCTLVYARFDFKEKRLRIAGSGLPYPLHYRAASGECEVLKAAGLPLGVFDEAEYEELSVPLASGDVLVFHTDGVTEAHNGREAYGFARLKRLVEERAVSAQDLGDRVIQDLDRFMGDAEWTDDVTLIVVRIL